MFSTKLTQRADAHVADKSPYVFGGIMCTFESEKTIYTMIGTSILESALVESLQAPCQRSFDLGQ